MAVYVSNSTSTSILNLRTDRSISELMTENVCNTPDSKIIYEDTLTGKTASYGGFRQQVSRVSRALRENEGLKQGDVVSILSPSCVDYLVVAHAVWYAGGVLSTVNHSASQHEVEYALKLIKPCFLVVNGLKTYSSTALDAVSRTGIKTRLLTICQRLGDLHLIPDDCRLSGSTEPCFSLRGKDARNICAAIILSSGTTGSPKAVMLSHHNLVSSCEQLRAHNIENWNSDQREIFFPVLSHIYGLYVCATMTCWLGAYSLMVPQFDLNQYLQLMSARQATLARIVPSIAKALVDSPLVNKYSFSKLQYFSCSAAPLTPQVASLLKKAFPHVAICQTYGCTEVSGAIAQSGTRDKNCPLVGAGSLIGNIEMRLIDEAGEDAPKGGPGEIILRGPTVMMGYNDDPNATSDSLTPDGKWYRTGDIGTMDENGYLSIVDRIKDIIKYKGFQVAPNELEEVISRHPAVAEVCVIGAWDESQSTEVPRAYVVARSHTFASEATSSEIVTLVRGQVAGYKALRGGVRFVDQLPKSATGKILRKELRKKEMEVKQFKSRL